MADDLILYYALAERFSAAGWSADTTSTLSLSDVEATLAKNYVCMILVINESLKEKILSQDRLIDQCIFEYSSNLPVYVVLEGAYDKTVDRHLGFAKRVFDTTHNAGRINDIVDAIVNPDPAIVNYAAFISPMSSI